MTIEDFANLTPRQLLDLYGHPRDKEGRIKPQKDAESISPEEADMMALSLAAAFGSDPKKVVEKIRRRRQAKE